MNAIEETIKWLSTQAQANNYDSGYAARVVGNASTLIEIAPTEKEKIILVGMVYNIAFHQGRLSATNETQEFDSVISNITHPGFHYCLSYEGQIMNIDKRFTKVMLETHAVTKRLVAIFDPKIGEIIRPEIEADITKATQQLGLLKRVITLREEWEYDTECFSERKAIARLRKETNEKQAEMKKSFEDLSKLYVTAVLDVTRRRKHIVKIETDLAMAKRTITESQMMEYKTLKTRNNLLELAVKRITNPEREIVYKDDGSFGGYIVSEEEMKGITDALLPNIIDKI